MPIKINNPEMLTKDELIEWFLHPVTKKVRHKIEKEITETQARLGDGYTLDLDSVEKTAILTAREVGKIEGLEFVFNMEEGE